MVGLSFGLQGVQEPLRSCPREDCIMLRAAGSMQPLRELLGQGEGNKSPQQIAHNKPAGVLEGLRIATNRPRSIAATTDAGTGQEGRDVWHTEMHFLAVDGGLGQRPRTWIEKREEKRHNQTE